LDIEAEYIRSVHIERDFGDWFDPEYTAIIDEQVENAEDGSEPVTGWRFINLTADHSRILAVSNPSGAHWASIEIVYRP
jgi:hypothetical protein